MTSHERSVPSGRAAARAQLERDILRLGREQLATVGAPALSLRAIARDLGMVSSAVYRYVTSRDELLTVLVIDAYNELADQVEQALDAARAEDRDRDASASVLTIAHAVRAWAIAEPSRFALIYGSPVPGYEAPSDQTIGPGTRVVALILHALDEAAWEPALSRSVPGSVSDGLAGIRAEFGVDLDDGALVVATCAWSMLLGAVSLEVFGQYGADAFADPAALFDTQMSVVLTALMRPRSS